MMISMRKCYGFTLIELMIVVALIAILGAIAVPMYRDFVIRSNRSDAVISLTEMANLQEKHFSNELRYTATVSELNYPTVSPNNLYNLGITTSATMDYVLTATPVAGESQADDDRCQLFTLNSFGQRGAQDGGGNSTTQECWNR